MSLTDPSDAGILAYSAASPFFQQFGSFRLWRRRSRELLWGTSYALPSWGAACAELTGSRRTLGPAPRPGLLSRLLHGPTGRRASAANELESTFVHPFRPITRRSERQNKQSRKNSANRSTRVSKSLEQKVFPVVVPSFVAAFAAALRPPTPCRICRSKMSTTFFKR